MSKILLVEDDMHTRAGLSEILTEEGHEVVVAEDATTALEKWHNGMDVLLTDLRLPDFSGFELHGKIRERHPDVKTIMVTACSGSDARNRAMELGIRAFITKPIDLAALLGAIDQVHRSRVRMEGGNKLFEPETLRDRLSVSQI